MKRTTRTADTPTETETWQERFLELLPRIQRHLLREFQHLRGEAKEEALSEGIAFCAVCFERLDRQGGSHKASATSMARFAARQIRSGRRIATQMNVHNPLSRYAQIRKRIIVERLDCHCPDREEWIEATIESRCASIPDQVALRIDVPAWLKTCARRTQRIARDMAMGWSTSELAKRYRISACRISQIRRELFDSWQAFQGLGPAPSGA